MRGVKVIAPEAPGPTTSNLSLSRRISVFTVPISESVLPVDGNAQPAGHHSARLGSALAGGTVGYQLTVQVEPVTESSARVTPAWAMNVSSEVFRPNLVAIPIEHRPILYVDFFDALDARLGLNTPAR